MFSIWGPNGRNAKISNLPSTNWKAILKIDEDVAWLGIIALVRTCTSASSVFLPRLTIRLKLPQITHVHFLTRVQVDMYSFSGCCIQGPCSFVACQRSLRSATPLHPILNLVDLEAAPEVLEER